MPARFPGMDPFTEAQAWGDFHAALITNLRQFLVPRLRPHYMVRSEVRVYLEHCTDQPAHSIGPDVTVAGMPRHGAASAAVAAPSATAPLVLTLPMPVEIHEHYLVIRWRQTMDVVTVIEVLSPGNKRRGSDGQREYLTKREAVLRSPTHLVELNLLRGGDPPPTVEPLPQLDYYAFVSRAEHRPSVDVYPWMLRESMRSIPIPLRNGDPDVTVDLQSVFSAVYDASDYDYTLDYTQPLDPPPSDADAAWVREVLGAR